MNNLSPSNALEIYHNCLKNQQNFLLTDKPISPIGNYMPLWHTFLSGRDKTF
jgi:hypothetical protein